MCPCIVFVNSKPPMKHFADTLFERVKKTGPLCVGLDPHIAHIPDFLLMESKTKAEAVWKFNQGIIDAIHDLVAVVKPQIAFFEALGVEGMEVYSKTVKYARSKGLLVIADIKRGDIGSTSEAYAKAHFEHPDFEIDAVTLSPYMGSDTIEPFLPYVKKGKGLFILVKTSNKSSQDFQDLQMGLSRLYQVVGAKVKEWGKAFVGMSGYSSIGAVVGATHPEELKRLRAEMPTTPFLVPGFGAQGGTAQDIKPAFDKNGLGAIVNSSRDIIFAYQKDPTYSPQDFQKAAREAVQRSQSQLK